MNKIQVMADSNERGNSRMAKLALALANDPRFEWKGYAELDVDLQFAIDNPSNIWVNGEKVKLPKWMFNVELKEPSDYIASALSPSGHLYQQVLSLRESGQPCMILVLGGDYQVTKAVKASLYGRYKGDELDYQIESYDDRLRDFEANAIALGVPVFRWETNQFERLLSTAHKALTGGNLYGYGPRPAEGERELVAASCLFKGIGHETMKNILEDYQLCFAPRNGYARPIEEIAGIGKKRAAMINPHIRMTYLEKIRV